MGREHGERDGDRHLSVVMLGVLQHGTTKAVKGSGVLSQELEVLQHNSDLAQRSTTFWQSRVRPPEGAQAEEDAIPIAAYAVVSERDF